MYNLLFGVSPSELNAIQSSLTTVDAPNGISGLNWLASNAAMINLREVNGVAYIDCIVDAAFMSVLPSTLTLFSSAKVIGVWGVDGSPYGYHFDYAYDASTGMQTKTLTRDLDINGMPLGLAYSLNKVLMLASKPDKLTFDLNGVVTRTARPTILDLTSPWAGWGDRH